VVHFTSARGGDIPPDPTGGSPVYEGPIAVSGDGTTMTVKAMATKAGMADSDIASAGYAINYNQVSTPQFSPVAGTYTSAQSVTIASATSGASIRYTTDGSEPTSKSGTLYTGSAVNVAVTQPLTAIAYKTDWADSSVATAAFTITGTVATPTFSPGAGTYTSTQNVTIASATSGASIRYTTDGSPPTSASGTLYSAPVSVAVTPTLTAIAYKTDWADSALGTADYGISGVVTTIAGTAGQLGSVDAVGSAASFNQPRGITTDGTDLYVAGYMNNSIRKIGIATGSVSTFAGYYLHAGNTDAAGNNARFQNPSGIVSDGANLYVTDVFSNVIRKIVIATAAVTHQTSPDNPTGGLFDGPWDMARFNVPNAVTTTGGNLYIADSVNNLIRKIALSTRIVSTFAGNTQAGSADGAANVAKFNFPTGITNDGTNLYVTDSYNHTIRKIDITTRVVTTLAGSTGNSGSADGTGSAARFKYPRGLAADDGILYVADTENNTIRKIVIATSAVTTQVGSAINVHGCTDGTGSAARFWGPDSIAVSGSYLYVTDSNNHTIRRISK
jgi:hypothetical protein